MQIIFGLNYLDNFFGKKFLQFDLEKGKRKNTSKALYIFFIKKQLYIYIMIILIYIQKSKRQVIKFINLNEITKFF